MTKRKTNKHHVKDTIFILKYYGITEQAKEYVFGLRIQDKESTIRVNCSTKGLHRNNSPRMLLNITAYPNSTTNKALVGADFWPVSMSSLLRKLILFADILEVRL